MPLSPPPIFVTTTVTIERNFIVFLSYLLAKAIGEDSLKIDRETIGLVSDHTIWVDVLEFQTLLAMSRNHNKGDEEISATCLASLTEALALYRADFMAGFNLSDNPDFEEWQFFQSESLRRDLTPFKYWNSVHIILSFR